jgi:tetratricopeptide (TPR) repeat protein
LSRARTETREVFVDREEQLATLDGVFGEVLRTGLGRVVFIDGEPGIGKTALMNRFLETIDRDSANVLSASGKEFGVGPYFALGEILEPLLRTTKSREIGRQTISTLANLGKLIPQFGVYIDAIVKAAKESAGLSSADIRQISDSLYVNHVFLSLLEKLSKKKPIVMIFDDVQRFDASSLEALGYLMDNIPKLPALAVICSRSKFAVLERERENTVVIEEMRRRTGAQVLHLERLQTSVSAQLVRQMARGKIQAHDVATLVDQTGGIPLYIVKTIKEMGDSDAIPHDMPTDMSVFVVDQLLQIADESEDARLILDYAAILGRQFSIPDLAYLSGVQPLRIKHTLEKIASRSEIVRAASPEVFEFDHDTTREIILHEQGSLARDLHLKVAEYYDSTDRTSANPQLTAFHYEMAGVFQTAFQLYRSSSQKCVRELSFDSAVQYLRRCFDMVESGKVPINLHSETSLLMELSTAEFSAGLIKDAYGHVQEAIRRCPPVTEMLAESHLLAGRCCRFIGTVEASERGREHLEIASQLFSGMQNYQMLGTTYSVLSTLCDHFGDHERAVKFYGKSHKALHLANDRTGIAVLQRKSGMVFDSRRAIPFITNAINVFRQTNSTIELARSHNNLGAEHFYLGDFESAEANLIQALDFYRKIDSYEIDAPLNNLGLVYTQMNRLDKALRVLTEAEDRATEDFDRICVATNIGTVQKLKGERINSLETLSRVIPIVERSGEPLIQDYFAYNLASVFTALGRHQEALEWVDRYPINGWKGDERLSRGKRLRLKGVILLNLGKEREGRSDIEASNQVFLTNRPQKWFYELDYYPCDIHFLD